MSDNRASIEYTVGDRTTAVRFVERAAAFEGIEGRGGFIYVFDRNTRPLVTGNLEPCVVLDAGEERKDWQSVDSILRAAISNGVGRDGVFIGCGGGVVCDIAAFAASIYMRGCSVVLVPTTLLAMVDAAFGGKTGIDFDGYKNMVGSFHPATELRIAVDFLDTLPMRDYRSGLAEVLKHSLLERSPLKSLLTDRREEVLGRDSKLLRGVVEDALSVKARVVERDFRETGERAHLNLGHTFGHALETVTSFRFTHGEAVAWGIDKALRTGLRLGDTDPEYAREVSLLLEAYGFELGNLSGRGQELLGAMRQDKKKRGGRVRFVLQHGWGDTYLSEVDDEIVLAALSE